MRPSVEEKNILADALSAALTSEVGTRSPRGQPDSERPENPPEQERTPRSSALLHLPLPITSQKPTDSVDNSSQENEDLEMEDRDTEFPTSEELEESEERDEPLLEVDDEDEEELDQPPMPRRLLPE